MYPVTESYKRAAEGAVRRESVGGSLTLEDGTVLPLTAGDLLSGSLFIDNQGVSGQELEFGCVYLGQARFRLRTAVSRYRLYGAAVALEYSIETDEGPFTLPLGRFTVAEAERSGAAVSLTCYDAVLALTKAYTGPAVQGTPWQMLDQIAAACGLTLAQTEEELQDWPNAGHIFQLSPADGCETWRDCAAAVAQVLGAFVTADRSGALAVRRFAGQACRSVGPSARCEAKVSDFTCHYCGVTAAELGAFAEDDTGLTLAFEDAPLLEQGVSAFRQQLLDAKSEDIAIVQSPVGMPGRALHSPLIKRVETGTQPRPDRCIKCLVPCDFKTTPYCISKALVAARNGDWENGLFFCGANAGEVNRLSTVREQMEQIMEEWRNA